ncbi:MAG: hypothetical protein FJ190_07495 [Gammaproteobacteria bacterium]|nr:hypothetical protein [Gammaproteobacteria bacterium]
MHGDQDSYMSLVKATADFQSKSRCPDVLVAQEIDRLGKLWGQQYTTEPIDLSSVLTPEQIANLDLFDQLQLQSVITVCRNCDNLAQAGRRLFAISRNQRGSINDSDRLRKYLAKFGLEWSTL